MCTFVWSVTDLEPGGLVAAHGKPRGALSKKQDFNSPNESNHQVKVTRQSLGPRNVYGMVAKPRAKCRSRDIKLCTCVIMYNMKYIYIYNTIYIYIYIYKVTVLFGFQVKMICNESPG